MNKDIEESKRQIFAMMKYLGYDKYSVWPLYGTFISDNPGHGVIYFDSEIEALIKRESGKTKKHKPKAKQWKWYIENVHDYLKGKCRDKALQKWANIELKNNNLFWCINGKL